MKVLLIQPPTGAMITTLLPRFVEEEAGFYPPLGLLYVAGALLARELPGVEVEAVDAVARGYSHDSLLGWVSQRAPDVVGITTTTFTLPDAVECARRIKAMDNGVQVVMGGPHVALYPQETAALPGVDFAVFGEAEATFPDLVDALRQGKSPAGLPGVCARDGAGGFSRGPLPAVPDRLDELPFPARQLLPTEDYYSIHGRQPRMTTMLTSRGCPYDCSFCYHSMGRKFRARTPANVVDEMESIAARGVREVFVFDDTFTVNKKRVAVICDEILARNLALKVGWDVRARIDTVNERLLQKLRESGCDRISFGIEAGTEEALVALKKEVGLRQTVEVVETARRLGFTTYADFILGNPGETRAQLQRSVDFALSLPLDYVQFAVLTPYPHTELYRVGQERGILPRHDYWREFARHPEAGFQPPVWEEHLGRDELFSAMEQAYRRFYLRPRFVWKRLQRIRGPADLARDARAALKMVGVMG